MPQDFRKGKVLQVVNLEKRFFLHRLGREVLAFQQVSFSLQAGEFLLLEGPNGSGKSSLLRTLYRSYWPTAGQALLQTPLGTVDLARLGDREVLAIRRERIGYVSQFLDPRPRTTALELVAEPLLWQGVAENQARHRAAELLLELGLKPELLETFPTSFSGGRETESQLGSLSHPPLSAAASGRAHRQLGYCSQVGLARTPTSLEAAGNSYHWRFSLLRRCVGFG